MELSKEDLHEIWTILVEETSDSEMRAMKFMDFLKRYEEKTVVTKELNKELNDWPNGEF